MLSIGNEPLEATSILGEKELGLLQDILLNMLQEQPGNHVHYLISSPRDAWDRLIEGITVLEAAGGVVERQDGRLLMIYRLGHWDLPKGKLEDGESIEEGAVREVEEECGISHPVVYESLKPTWHAYLQNGQIIIKCTHWFLMMYNGWDALRPQREEGIDQIGWFDREEVDARLPLAYPAIRELLKAN